MRAMPSNWEPFPSPVAWFAPFFTWEKNQKRVNKPFIWGELEVSSPTNLPGRERNSVALTASTACSYLLMGKMEIPPKFVPLNSYLRGWNLKVMKKTSSLNLSFNLLTFFLLFFFPGEVSALVWKTIIPLVRCGVNWRRFSIPRELSFQYLSFLLNIEMGKKPLHFQ